jgi:hypothetical protein
MANPWELGGCLEVAVSYHVWSHPAAADARYVDVSVSDDLEDLKNAPRP